MEMESYLLPIITAITGFFVVFLASTRLLKKKKKKNSFLMPINWPLVGMIPHLVLNVHRIHPWLVQLLTHSNGTFLFKGPWFSSMELLLTTDPSNVHYVMSKNFPNFPKGPDFSQIFDILGDGIFNADSELWRYQRKVAHSFLTHPSFHRFLSKTLTFKVDKGLMPILEAGYESGLVVDLEDLFQRLTFDIICMLVTGSDPACLTLDLPEAPFCKALDEAEEVLFLRHLVPETIWKLQRWLQIGSERKLSRAWQVLDGFIYNALATKRQDMINSNNTSSNKDVDGGVDLLTLYMQEDNNDSQEDFKFSNKFLRDMFLNLLIAGRDTTSAALTWFFWLLHKNPLVEAKIRQELDSITSTKRGVVFPIGEVGKLTYLHGALCETLRLYPSVPFEHKSPLEHDTLPTGHQAKTGTKVMFILYAMGRTESIWGEDCLEFKPERWITESGRVKHEPSYKFLAFNAGPRTCLGKEMAFLQMKVVVATVLINGYRLQVVDDHKVEPDVSIILHTKHGLKANVVKIPF